MKFFVLLWIASAAALEVQAATQEQNVIEAAKANNEFSLDLVKLLSSEAKGKNVFFSPYSISSALAMVALGAGGATLDEIDRFLHFNRVDDKADNFALHKAYEKLVQRYSSKNSDYTLETANRLFGTNTIKINDEFQTEILEYYKGQLQQVNFASGTAEGIINQWVSEKTHDKINDLFKPRTFNERTALVLVNAIYFKGNWKVKFNKANTRNGQFYVQANQHKTVDMMSITSKFNYLEDHQLQAKVLYLPYNGDGVEMFIVLPNNHDGLSEVLKNLNPDKLNSLATRASGGRTRKVDVAIPKFKLETEYALLPVLQTLGINNLFNPRANLSGITNVPTYVSAVTHKAFVEVNEEGTEAAAATGIGMVAMSAIISEPPSFVVDHPFYFAIVDTKYGNILFSGAVYDP